MNAILVTGVLDAAKHLAAAQLKKGFVLTAVHEYTDKIGQAVFWRARMKNPTTGEKWIRPIRRSDSGYVFGEPPTEQFPDGKLLYRLHHLDAQLDHPVFVVEGEFKADKLAELGLVVTTSGGADSAAKADWSALAGRQVRIWPDNDDAGQRYATTVAAILQPLGCGVAIVDVTVLGLEAKGDAIDWLATRPGASGDDVLVLSCTAVKEPGGEDAPNADRSMRMEVGTPRSVRSEPLNVFAYEGGYIEVRPEGIYFVEPAKANAEDTTPQELLICSQLVVLAMTRDGNSNEWGRLIEWPDADDVLHQWAMPVELVETDGADLRRELARKGLRISPSLRARALLMGYLKGYPAKDRVLCVDRVGWHGPVFVLPSEAIGELNERVVYQSNRAIEPAFKVKGTVDVWRTQVAALAAGNSRLVFALAVSFAPALAELVGEDSGGFHLRGKSSTGKTTALRVAASVWGSPDTYPRLWRTTANGLEGLAAMHNDCLLILDELSQVDPREAGESAYLLANGQGKTRASQTGAARSSQRWRLVFLSSGEESLAALMSKGGKKANAGQEIRMADIDADAGVGMGLIECLHGFDTSMQLVMAIKDAAASNHGAVGIEWLRCVVKDRGEVARFAVDGMNQFVAEVMPAGATGQIERVARRFALVAIAGELATHYGLTGWEPGEANRAVTVCFRSWLDSFGGVGNREERAVLAQVRAFFEAHGASRFEDLHATTEQRVVNRAGFWRDTPKVGREYLVLPEVFSREVCQGFDPKAAVAVLLAHGWITKSGDGRTMQKPRLPGLGTSSRVYVFNASMWDGDE